MVAETDVTRVKTRTGKTIIRTTKTLDSGRTIVTDRDTSGKIITERRISPSKGGRKFRTTTTLQEQPQTAAKVATPTNEQRVTSTSSAAFSVQPTKKPAALISTTKILDLQKPTDRGRLLFLQGKKTISVAESKVGTRLREQREFFEEANRQGTIKTATEGKGFQKKLAQSNLAFEETKFAKSRASFREGVNLQLEEKPIQTTGLFLLGGGIGAAGKAVALTGKGAAIGVKTAGAVGTGLFLGTETASIALSDTPAKTAGSSFVKTGAFFAGARAGSSIVKAPSPKIAGAQVLKDTTVVSKDRFLQTSSGKANVRIGKQEFLLETKGLQRGVQAGDKVSVTGGRFTFIATQGKTKILGFGRTKGLSTKKSSITNIETFTQTGKGKLTSTKTIETGAFKTRFSKGLQQTQGIERTFVKGKGGLFKPKLFSSTVSQEQLRFNVNGQTVSAGKTGKLFIGNKALTQFRKGFLPSKKVKFPKTKIAGKVSIKGKSGNVASGKGGLKLKQKLGGKSVAKPTLASSNLKSAAVSLQKTVNIQATRASSPIAIPLTRVKSRSLIGTKIRQRPSSKTLPEVLPDQDLKTRVTTKTASTTKTRFDQFLAPRVSTKSVTRQATGQRGIAPIGFAPVTLLAPAVTIPFLPSGGVSSFSFGSKKRKGRKVPTVPTFSAAFLNIKSKGKSEFQLGKLTGLTIRGL